MVRKIAGRTALVVFIIFIVIVFSLYQCGQQKISRLSPDDRRVQDVLSLSWRIMFYAQRAGRLPSSISDVAEGEWKIPVDPTTSLPYFYEALGRDSFRLCAVFSSASGSDVTQGEDFYWASKNGIASGVRYGDPVVHGFGSWTHGPGRQCLDRSVPRVKVRDSRDSDTHQIQPFADKLAGH